MKGIYHMAKNMSKSCACSKNSQVAAKVHSCDRLTSLTTDGSLLCKQLQINCLGVCYTLWGFEHFDIDCVHCTTVLDDDHQSILSLM